jgi:AcrR family transcriptional regulator
MPRSLDTAARDRAVIDAAWRLLARDGVEALTIRRVAAEAGLAPSSLRYTFPTQADIRSRAVGAVSERLTERLAELPASLTGRAWARAALLELLPLDEQRRLEMHVFLALGMAAVTDARLLPLWNEADATVREVCARAVAAVGEVAGERVDLVHALVDGLALHLLVRPGADGEGAARAAIDLFLSDVRRSP